ncbi:uncharacterized protein LOC128912336 [Rissa tridactyla]|uniref:uncharacterized protein LOC128912336 n=1 Tax=Rissa tridactyla TaxID=75485 RepID=UPI0023BA5A76|nr:uncharacterized protein LOC128912336 [Rissa tridactyla]
MRTLIGPYSCEWGADGGAVANGCASWAGRSARRWARGETAAGSKSEPRGPGTRSGRARREHVVRQLDRVKDEEPYRELYPRVCEGLSNSSKVVVHCLRLQGSVPVTAMFPPPSAGCLLHTSCSLGVCAVAIHVTGSPGALWDPTTLLPWSPLGPYYTPALEPSRTPWTPHIPPELSGACWDTPYSPLGLPGGPWDPSTHPQDTPEPPGTPHSPLGPPGPLHGDTSSCQMLWEHWSLTGHLGKEEMSERGTEQGPPGCREEE